MEGFSLKKKKPTHAQKYEILLYYAGMLGGGGTEIKLELLRQTSDTNSHLCWRRHSTAQLRFTYLLHLNPCTPKLAPTFLFIATLIRDETPFLRQPSVPQRSSLMIKETFVVSLR